MTCLDNTPPPPPLIEHAMKVLDRTRLLESGSAEEEVVLKSREEDTGFSIPCMLADWETGVNTKVLATVLVDGRRD